MLRIHGTELFTFARSNLCLGNTTDLLCSVLSFLLLFPAGLSLGFNDSLSDQSVLGLKLFSIVHGVINQSESSRLATSKISFETKSKDSVGGGKSTGFAL